MDYSFPIEILSDPKYSTWNNISDYCLFIQEAGMIAQLRDSTEGIRGLGKVDKIYLDNTNLIYSLASNNSKGLKQIQGIDNAFIVKDDIGLGYLNTVPLWQLGLTY